MWFNCKTKSISLVVVVVDDGGYDDDDDDDSGDYHTDNIMLS